MSSKEVNVNGIDFKVILTDNIVNQVNQLKSLYNMAYEDPESFEQVSSEISNTINEIASTVEPPVSDNDLDGLIQEIIKVVDEKAAEVEKEMQNKDSRGDKKVKSSAKKKQNLKNKIF